MFKQTNPVSKLKSMLFWGQPNSGKTTIADYMCRIFSSAILKMPTNNFTEDIKIEDASKQVVQFDDLDLCNLFAKDRMSAAKDLLAGYGWQINAKSQQQYIGFKNCFTFLSTNNLAYPFIAPKSSSAGFNEAQWMTDKRAIDVRCISVEFKESHDQERERFPFT